MTSVTHSDDSTTEFHAAIRGAAEQLHQVASTLEGLAFGSVTLRLGEGRYWQTLPNALAMYAEAMRAQIAESAHEDLVVLDPREEQAESATRWIEWLRAQERNLDESLHAATPSQRRRGR